MKERENFASRMGFILVSAGCAIGIGNVWRFPYITGKYGGAAFVLIYLFFLVIMGLPVMVMEDSRLTPRRVQLLNDDNVEITVSGPPSQVTLMRDVQLTPYVDISGIREPGEYQLPVECRMPDDVESAVKRVFPAKVKVKIAQP